MPEYQNDDGTWCVADGVWLPGLYKSRQAAALAKHCSDEALDEAWKRRLEEFGGVIEDKDGFKAALSEEDVRAIYERKK